MHLHRQLSLNLELPLGMTPILFPVGKRVAAGVRFLDGLEPEWRSKIDVERLDIESSSACVLGQLFGNYKVGCCELGLNPNSDEPARLGFSVLDSTNPNVGREFEALTRVWKLVLKVPDIEGLEQLRIYA